MAQDRCKRYWDLCTFDDGKKPALCFLTPEQLAAAGVAPRLDIDKQDSDYGHLHHLTDCVADGSDDGRKILMNLAKRATENGLLRPLIHPTHGMKPPRWVGD